MLKQNNKSFIKQKEVLSYGKILVISLSENEEQIFTQTVKWLSDKLNCSAVVLEPQQQEFSIDPYTRNCITEYGKSVYLTAKQFDLLYFLYSHKGQVFTKEQLYEKVWGYEDVIDGSNLTSFIRKLRKKIEPIPDNPQYIITVWGVGYKFNEEKP
ncbi:winged helix family transcriptional regulator [Clostridioides difficile]|uniref:winged helix-turn-helix domain-containing protein n=1 Tax=Clostridioides difficile TaxID=1496 RepID=UPI0009A93E32|nr:winged helix-turn-helix domain-containing protein [Clostridioides difficile]MCJ0405597.1 winged helix-turn-helix domain-containing protein [Clostridioides difficile]MDB2780090.1 winged helix family transcriptional regulator [Clostridioides difficile]OYO87305.1 transcriptional regulator [Clostridioides difficile]HBG7071624.1 winged helix-turn-helix domain-containing protein [Clostridioides difficile]HBG7266571.1 winged helix-turn-helix domain-containing protein [Clostridioides difficile]